jgi:hypothetical protein
MTRQLVDHELGSVWLDSIMASLRYPGINRGDWVKPQEFSKRPISGLRFEPKTCLIQNHELRSNFTFTISPSKKQNPVTPS